jgi:hypothetical protein
MSTEQEEELVEYVTAIPAGRRASFLALSLILFGAIFGVYTIRNTLRRLGFARHVAVRKPVITEKTRRARLTFASEYINWTVEDWKNILWSDETWVTGGTHRRVYVTRRAHETLTPECVIERHQRKKGWMFWGSFSGIRKGPGLFWEKEWGTINSLQYQTYILPLVKNELTSLHEAGYTQVQFMQDNAPAYGLKSTREFMVNQGIPKITWPPNSPDLNPIETVWCWMKDYIQQHYGLVEKPTLSDLRNQVTEAWEAVPDSLLQSLLESMPARIQAVIDANGMFTRY